LVLVSALLCVAITIALAGGHVAGTGARPLGVIVLLLVAVWCLLEPRAERTLLVFGLYIALLDGYLKLRTGDREITLIRDVLLWAIAVGVLWRAVRRGDSVRLPPLGLFVAAFVLVILIQLANPHSPPIVQGLGGLRQHLEFVPLFFLGYALLRTRRKLTALLVLLVAVAAANGVVSYVQSTLTPEQLAGWGSGYYERIVGTGIFVGQGKVSTEVVNGAVTGLHVRPFGLGSEIGAGAVTAALALPALLALLMSGRRGLRTVALVTAPGIALAIVTSGSRGALLACVVSLLAFLLLAGASRNLLRLAGVAALLTLLVAVTFNVLGTGNDAARRAKTVVPTRVLSTYWDERGDSLGRVGEYLRQHPLGLGVGSVGPAAHVISGRPPQFDAETEWNLMVLEAGAVGLIVLILFGGRLIVLSVREIRSRPDSDLRLQLAAVSAPLVALFVLCFGGPTSVTAPTAPFFWLAAGTLSYWLLGPGATDNRAERESA
jgi:hypothetical protein